MSLLSRTDVTCVKFYKSYVLAGIGSFVSIFDKISARLIKRFQVLNGQKIYGFVTSDCQRKILVFGGKQFSVVSVEPSESENLLMRLFEPVVCDDWMHSAVWMDDVSVAILTAHNVVQIWDISTQSLQKQYHSNDNSILYSGLLLPLQDDLLVFAGTVFSEVIIHRCSDVKPLHYLKGHRGVIFSISCDLQRELIVTTSDDRSVRIWGIDNPTNFAPYTKDYWENITIICQHEVYGHMARVMRSCITNDLVISVGEDSVVCFWDRKGGLLRKVGTHQNGCIWSLDHDNEHLVTGGGDCGVFMHPLSSALEYGHNEVLGIEAGTPKKVVFTARRNLVILNDNDELVYYDMITKSKLVYKLNHESTYKLLGISSCKQIVAIGDMKGKLDVFVENCKETAYLQNIIDTKLKIGKILSLQWAGNRHLILCSDNGIITVLASKANATEVYANFLLPQCKERWLTASAIDATSSVLVLGDRCGNVHVYNKDKRDPIKTFSKVHGRYGPTSITVRNNEILTTGRDGTIKYFTINNDATVIKYARNKELDFQWVEKFLDRDELVICGFQERIFVVYNTKTNSRLLEVTCGGGHRSWDAVRYIEKVDEEFDECIRLVYMKNSDINLVTFQLSKIVSKNIINGSHSKEINCLKTHITNSHESKTYYISGGEDTTLRISSINSDLQFEDEIVFKQLSNIRTLKTYALGNNWLLLISAGGRAQINVKTVTFEKVNNEIKLSVEELTDYMIKGTDKDRKGKTWRNCSVDFDPETRIMDLEIVKINDNEFKVFTGCSDACLRVFNLTIDANNVQLQSISEVKYHKTCILKTHCINILDKDILVTCTTRGEVTFWDVTNLENDSKPIFATKTNKSGINSLDSRVISAKQLLIATGGDDNAIHIILLEIGQNEAFKVLSSWSSDQLHCSQITGLILLEDILVSTSVDQRITVCKWEAKEDRICCHFLAQTYTDVADVQGMDLIESSSDSATVCVYGKGMEVVAVPRVL